MSITEDEDFKPPDIDHDRAIGRRRDDVIQAISFFELKLRAMEKECEHTRQELIEHRKWIETDKERSSWFYANRSHLEAVVEGSKWASMTRKVVMLIVGTILGAIMFFQAVWPFFESRLRP